MRKLSLKSNLAYVEDMPCGKRSKDSNLGPCRDKSLLFISILIFSGISEIIIPGEVKLH